MRTLSRSSFVLIAATLLAGIVSAAALKTLPDPAVDASAAKGKATAVLAGGCFWCTEAVFEAVAGVDKVVSGYAGGKPEQAKYDAVSAGRTEHAEAIQITYDPAKVSYGMLLKIFFSVAHDPTTLDRQGPDSGKQYRSEIFCANAEQKKVAEAYIQQLQEAKVFAQPIVTKISDLKGFYPAEEYHQDFVKRNPSHPYVVANARPKLEKLKKEFPQAVKK